MPEVTDMRPKPDLTPEEARDVQLLEMVRGIETRLANVEAEQKALDTNTQHIAAALQAIVEAAQAKVLQKGHLSLVPDPPAVG